MLTRTGKDKNYEVEGIVTSVDIVRGVCKVLCKDGRALINVPISPSFGGMGRSGFNYSPSHRERVRVRYDSGGNPYISSSCPPLTFSRQDKTYIGVVQEFDDKYFYSRYNASMVSSKGQAGTSRPIDQIPGDTSITQGGGVLGVTRVGSIFAKASPWAQIFVTKIDDMIKVIARNYHQFSESAKKVQENVKGRIYQYHAWYMTKESSRDDEPEYEEIIGDVAAGDFTKGDKTDVALPAADERLYQRQVNNDRTRRYTETMDVNGEETSTSTDGASNSVSKVHSNTKWSVLVSDGSSSGYEEIIATRALIQVQGGGSVALQFNDDGTATLVGDTSLLVDFPDVTVNSETSTVNATTSIEANAPTITANATTSATVTAPTATVNAATSLTVNSPLSTFSGLVTAPTIAIGPAGAPVITGSAAGLNMIGANVTLDATSDVTFGATTLKTHIHTADGASPTPGPTTPPIQ